MKSVVTWSNALQFTIPPNVTKIGASAFTSCKNLDVRLQEIGNFVFSECHQLKEVVIRDSVRELGEYAFGYSSLCSVTLSKSLQSISEGTCTFIECGNLQSINIPDGVTTIKNNSFIACYSLQSVTLPESLQDIEEEAFIREENDEY